MNVIEFIQLYPNIGYTLILMIGLIVGSCLNVIILRTPKILYRQFRQDCVAFFPDLLSEKKQNQSLQSQRYNLFWPPSHCFSCQTPVKPWHNVPVLSYLFLRGRCHHCKNKISARYPLVELISGGLSLTVALNFGFTVQMLFALLFTWSLIALTFIDIDEQILPDDITLLMIWLGLGLSLYSIFITSNQAIIGAIIGYLSLWSIYWLFKLLTGKEGMGYGDFKLLAMLGAWMGWQLLPFILLLSSLLGALVGVSLILFKGHKRNQPIPFGPYLAIAGWLAFMWGDTIIQYNKIILRGMY